MLNKTFLFILMVLQIITEPLENKSIESEIIPSQSEKLRILSWNIYMLPVVSLFNGNTKRAKLIAEKLHNSDYQIIVFQEAFSSASRSIISKQLKDTYPYQYGPANKKHPPLKTNSGLWVVSKIPLEELDEIRYNVSEGYDKIARKGAAIFQGQFNGVEFQLITTHLQADAAPEIREKQCIEIMDKLLNKYYQPHIPQIICGDFNIEMDNKKDYPVMLQTLDATNGEITGDKTTYDEVFNTLGRKREGKRKTIDYVLIRNEQWIKEIKRRVNTFYEESSRYIGHLSDHYALEAELVFVESNVNQMSISHR
ncbi:MAG TPA: sphingomyelin phosphodiesterase [Paludibacteraceae bacterium]|nr:sphingomyelin phosphodiesterase [Paludibacteraceae bacterium]HPQ13417.1 sphingomyelin phosphodiesterase [Paludibacteraceae bacterium]